MTIVPEWKICSICQKKYSWNPDVGKVVCPYCIKDEKKTQDNLLNKILGNRKKEKS